MSRGIRYLGVFWLLAAIGLGLYPTLTRGYLKSVKINSAAPVNTNFSLQIPKIGLNALIVENVDPADYQLALQDGVAHAKNSFTPDQNGTVYLFSHSTNYQWFVPKLNAAFYLLQELTPGDVITVYYKNQAYNYSVKETKIIWPTYIDLLVPQLGKNELILETCWPPGSLQQRLIVVADIMPNTIN